MAPDSGASSFLGNAWRRYRGWNPWVQVVVAIFALGLVVSPFTGDSSDTEEAGTPTTTAEVSVRETTAVTAGPFTLTVTGEPEGAGVRVSGTTNLPDGALITVGVTRSVRYESEDEERAHRLGGAGVRVQSGAFSSTVVLDEDRIVALLEDDMRQPDAGGLGRISTISNSVVVCATCARVMRTASRSSLPPS